MITDKEFYKVGQLKAGIEKYQKLLEKVNLKRSEGLGSIDIHLYGEAGNMVTADIKDEAFYNKTIKKAKKFLNLKLEKLQAELDLLIK